ncbi:MAG TPA: PAS domain S-box protein [candidate division WOR-3 bacterium]|uniref:histidine kinase n=1 Tax=candidate division WOR-3 bacterium TaxID=2052148 RepID=A0A7C0ZCX9_UNCW3|nr:PAS domain S-box protein [candidate division WOR-3 bacterium]
MKATFDILKEFARRLGPVSSLDDICNTFVSLLNKHIKPQVIALFITEEGKRYFYLGYGYGLKHPLRNEPMAVGSLPWEWLKQKNAIDGLPEGTVLSIPLIHAGGLEGLLCLGFKKRIPAEVQDLLEVICFNAAGLISQIKAKETIKELRKRESRKYSESLERINLITENTPLGIFIMEERKLVYVNPAMVKIFGYTHEELKQLNFPMDLIEEADKKRLIEALQTPSPFECKCIARSRTKSGETRFIRLWARGIIQSGKEYLLGTISDITSLRETRMKLKGMEELFSSFIETIPDIVFIFKEGGEILYANEAVKRIIGWEPEELVGKNIYTELDRSQNDDVTRAIKGWRKTEDNKEGTVFNIITRDGEEKFIEFRLISHKDTTGQNYYTAIGRDLTDEIKSEYTLRDVSSRFDELLKFQELLFELAPVGIVVLNAKLECTRINRRAVEISGYEPDEILGKKPFELIIGKDKQKLLAEWFKNLEMGSAKEIDIEIYNKSGEQKILRLIGKKIVTESEGHAILLMVRDITDEKRMEENILQMQKLESISTFTAGIAHDINNTLTAIMGSTGLLYNYVSKDGMEYIRAIEDAVKTSSEMIRQLLSFTKQRVGEPVVFDVNELIKETMSMVKRMIPEDVKCTTILNPSPLLLYADKTQLQEILINLVSNAIDAMPNGGKLTINSKLIEDYVIIQVIDTGIGMDEQTKKRIFDPFFTTKEKGTGLGLSVVYGLVGENNGTIEVDSAPGEGTTFTIKFPLYHGKASKSRSEEKVEIPTGNEDILLIEDEDIVRRTVAKYLRNLGYNVITGSTVHDAKEILLSDKAFHLIVSDIVLPDGNAMEIFKFMESSKIQKTPILFISGYTDDTLVKRGVKSGDFHFLQKPFQPSTLAEKIREILNGIDTGI